MSLPNFPCPCPQSCPCELADAFVEDAYVFTVKAETASSVIQVLNSTVDSIGNKLKLAGLQIAADVSTSAVDILTSTTTGSVVFTVVLDVAGAALEFKEAQTIALMNAVAIFDTCVQQIQGVLVASPVGTTLETITAVAKEAASALITLEAIQVLFCESQPPVPVKVFFKTKAAQTLADLIKLRLYICTGEPLNTQS